MKRRIFNDFLAAGVTLFFIGVVVVLVFQFMLISNINKAVNQPWECKPTSALAPEAQGLPPSQIQPAVYPFIYDCARTQP